MSLEPHGAERPPDRARNPHVALAIRLALLGSVLIIVLLAIGELRSGGTDIEATSVTNHLAKARADDRPAPKFTMPSLNGGPISLSSFEGRTVVLNFWASWCAPCRHEAPGLERTWADFGGRAVQFLGVDYQDSRTAARAFQRDFGITYPSVFDPRGTLADEYGLIGLPATFIISPDGRIIYRFTGYLDETVLRRALAGVLSGKVT